MGKQSALPAIPLLLQHPCLMALQHPPPLKRDDSLWSSGAGAALQAPGDLPAPLEEAEIPSASRCQGRARTLQAVGPSPGKVPHPPADPVGLKRSWERSDFGALAPWLAARIKSSQILPNQSARWGRACRDRERLARSPPLIPWPFRRAGSLVSHGVEVTAEGIGWQLPALDLLPRRKPGLLVSAAVWL